MMQATIYRVESADDGTFGALVIDDQAVCVTLERPWHDNEPFISCIPDGFYKCKRVDSPSYGDTFEVIDVDGRTDILFHEGNWKSNSKGCILLGTSYREFSDGTRGVASSSDARRLFMQKMAMVSEFELTIKNCFG